MLRPATGSALLLLALALGAAAAEGTPPATCTLEGFDWRADPVYRAAEHPVLLGRPKEAVICVVTESRVIQVSGTTIRVTRSELFETSRRAPGERGARQPVRLVSIGRLDGAGETSLARALLADDPLDGRDRFEPQLASEGGAIVARLSPRHPLLLRIEGGRIETLPADGWRAGALRAVPPGLEAGQTLGIDLGAMTGRIALQPARSAEPARPASAYRPSPVLVASLAWREGRLAVTATRIAAPGEPGAEPTEIVAEARGADRAAMAEAGSLPEGTEPCGIEAWSNDRDPRGLNVRAGPAGTAKRLGIVPPPWKAPPQAEAFGPEPLRAEFRVVGHRDGWFLIDRIQAPGAPYGLGDPRRLPQPFKGRGWVAGSMVGGAYAHAGMPAGRLYDAPQADASWHEARDSHGQPISADGSPRRVLACSGTWVLVETDTGQRGWLRSLCANQATNCS
jgi:hypothetical protein